jgi:hypothetical protein
MPAAVRSGAFFGTLPVDLLTGRPILPLPFIKPDGTDLYEDNGAVEKVIDHTWEGDGSTNRVIDLGDDYDLILVWREEDDDTDTDHPAMAYAFGTCYGHFMNQSSPAAAAHRGQAGLLSNQSWQGKLFGGDANKIKLGTSGAGNTFNGSAKTYRLVGFKFTSLV